MTTLTISFLLDDIDAGAYEVALVKEQRFSDTYEVRAADGGLTYGQIHHEHGEPYELLAERALHQITELYRTEHHRLKWGPDD